MGFLFCCTRVRTHMPGAGKNGKKPSSQKSRRCKTCVRNLNAKRVGTEKDCRATSPHCLIPCFTCCCVAVKVIINQLLEPFIVPIVCVASLISFVMRFFRCPHGQDLVYSCMEFMEIVDMTIGLYWEVAWWREFEREEEPHERQV